MKGHLQTAFAALLAALFIVGVPIMLIMSLNVLFGADIEITMDTWLAAAALLLLARIITQDYQSTTKKSDDAKDS